MNKIMDKSQLMDQLKTKEGIKQYLAYQLDVNVIAKNIIKSGDLEVKVERQKR